MFREKCIVCDNKLVQIIDLGMHPFADTFIPKTKISEPDYIYPLICMLCEKCGHIQTKCIIDPKKRYIENDYSYTSSNSETSKQHWDEFSKTVLGKIKENSLIIEIGSNDGYLAQKFLDGNKVIGIDPSKYMSVLAKKRGVDTIVDFFGMKTSQRILNEYKKVDVVIANNVFNHADNIMDFVKAVSHILSEEGYFIFEVPYWYIGFNNKGFDQIYHEHVSYFTVKSAKEILKRVDMIINDVQLVDYHGGSLRIFAKKKGTESEKVEHMVQKEIKGGIFNLKLYEKFMDHIISKRDDFLEKLYKIRKGKLPVIAIGAPAKGNTFLNFYKLDKTVIDYITDSSDHKKGKFTPATRILITDDDIFSKYDDIYAIILSWNIKKEIKEKLLKINPKIKFISPY